MTAAARRSDLRLLPVAAITWIATSASVLAPHLAVWIAAAAAMGCVVLLGVSARRGATMAALLAVGLAFAAAGAGHVAAAQPSRTWVSQVTTGAGRAVTVDAVVVGKVEPRGRGWTFDALTSRVRVGATAMRTSVPIVASVDEVPAGLDLGAVVTVSGSAAPTDPGDRAIFRLSVRSVQVRAPPGGVWAIGSALRHGLISAASELPEPGAGLIAGLAVGDTSMVTRELDADMKASSLSHLTAVSGANCALIVGIAFGIAALFGAGRAARVITAGCALTAFVVLVSPEPSVVRAGAMASIAMSALLLGRSGAGVAVLGLAVTILLVADPWLSMSLGFALSAAATLSLLLAAGPLAEGLSRALPRPLALLVAVPLAAQLACGPLLVLVTPSVSLYGVAANLVAGPAAPAATVLGLIACLTAAIPVLSAGVTALAWLPASWIAGTATVVSDLPGNTVPWWEGWVGAAALTVVGVAVLAAVVRVGPLTRARRPAVFVLAAIAGCVLATGPILDAVDRQRIPGDWSVAACDVGQGDALLVRSSGRVALIDTGPAPQPLSRCLDRFGIERIDLLVLTHFDLDHRGGLPAVLGRIDVALHGPAVDSDATEIVREVARGGARTVTARAGLTGRLGDSSWRVLWPRGAHLPFSGNDASIVMEFAGGSVPRMLLLGDLSAAPQASLATQVTSRYDVVKVAHHGSADQFAPLYARAAARLALVSVGENTYGHPRQETLTLLTDAGAQIARTDRGGAVVLWLSAAAAGRDAGARSSPALRVWRERGVDAAR